MFNRRVLGQRIAVRAEELLDCTTTVYDANDDVGIRNACIGVMINYTILFRDCPKQYVQEKNQCLDSVLHFVKVETKPPLQYRLLITLGTLVYYDEKTRQLAEEFGASGLVEKIGQSHKEKDETYFAAIEVMKCLITRIKTEDDD